MINFIQDKLEKFYENLNARERCVFEEALMKRQSNDEVIKRCWGTPVTRGNVSIAILKIKIKFLEQVMEYNEIEIEEYIKKEGTNDNNNEINDIE